MSDQKKETFVTEITPRSQDFSRWYLDVVRRAEDAPTAALMGPPAAIPNKTRSRRLKDWRRRLRHSMSHPRCESEGEPDRGNRSAALVV